MAGIDLFFLGIAIGFGPEGFGGDAGPLPAHLVMRAHVGIGAGIVGLGLPVIALLLLLLLPAYRRPALRALTVLVGIQASCFALLVWSMT
ncbi:hypothetical protein [Krasilnikovia sp. MM14-A1004]|uniref:hypothetical protein n=1 Tax=Krasilnikovia sp. MM14-A1004 TaxID=3373541 RepID=UPI00399CF921